MNKYLMQANHFFEDILEISWHGSTDYTTELAKLIYENFGVALGKEKHFDNLKYWAINTPSVNDYREFTSTYAFWLEAVADIIKDIETGDETKAESGRVEENTMTYEQFYDKLEEYEDFYAYLNYFARDFEVWYKGGTMPLMTVNVDHVGSIGTPLNNFESEELEILELLIKIAKTPIDKR